MGKPARRHSGIHAPGHPLWTPASRVRWLSPTELLRTGLMSVVSEVFGKYSDKRELQQGGMFDQGHYFDHSARTAPDGAFWLDYVSDIGDGFDATFTVARLLAGEIELPDELGGSDLESTASEGPLPRGSVLVMGGDEVYPAGNVGAYEQRTTTVYEMALPLGSLPEGERPVLYAVPGNHDWYDGLTAFLRVFAQCHDIGGWQTRQRRSYFALKLPRNWWVVAVDIQLDTYLDAPQLRYFEEVAEQMAAGDEPASVILCTAAPCWYQAGDGDDASLARLLYFLRTVLHCPKSENKPVVRLVLTGDAHHYARYTQATRYGEPVSDGQVLLTAGHGGAFCASTHSLNPEPIKLPVEMSDPHALVQPDDPDTDTYELAAGRTWPRMHDSKLEASRIFGRLLDNGWFLPVLCLVHLMMGAAVLSRSVVLGCAVAAAVGVSCYGFADPRRGGTGRKVRYGLLLGVPQLLLLIGDWAATWFLLRASSPPIEAVDRVINRIEPGPFRDWERWLNEHSWSPGVWLTQAVLLAVLAFLAGLISAQIIAFYLLFAGGKRRVNDNELFAAQAIPDYKGFLRLRIAEDGRLTVFPIGVKRVPRRWTPSPELAPKLGPMDRAEDFRPRLIDEPIHVVPASRMSPRHPRADRADQAV